jgi:hypothetical protein
MGRQRRSELRDYRGKTVPGLIFPIVMITFIGLKLTGVISWAWWWVLSPLWIGGILVVLGAAYGLLIGFRWYARRM